jgi:twitching motility protein PilT
MDPRPSSTALRVAEAIADGKRPYVEQALRYLVTKGGSDLHLTAGAPPLVRLHGNLLPIPGAPELDATSIAEVLDSYLDETEKREEFAEENEVDFSFELPEVARFRVNAYRQRGAVSMVLRAIPFTIRTIEELDLPAVVKKLAEEERGLVLVTGATGSGKSTTIAAMIDHINETSSQHIVTIEDPIEFLYANKRAIISQREVGVDTASFGRALRRVLRQDPDVILIGEIRDTETMETALGAAETGHLVLATLHTLNATETIARIISLFPPHMQQQARYSLAGTLRGVIAQRLVASSDGTRRVPVAEVLVSTARVRDLILEPARIEDLSRVIAEGEYYGMQTFEQSLLARIGEGQITLDEAVKVSSNPSDLKLRATGSAAAPAE